MGRVVWVLLCAFLTAGAAPAPMEAQPSRPRARAFWVFLRDKGADASAPRRAARVLSERAYQRRRKRGRIPLNETDMPVFAPYLRQVSGEAERLRTVSRWFNAVSVEATPAQIERIARLPEVLRIAPVAIGVRAPYPAGEPVLRKRPARDGVVVPSREAYGGSFRQDERIGVPTAHAKGLNGAGVLICVIDAGFEHLDHPALAHIVPTATRDFVTGGPKLAAHPHGSQVLSILAGWETGALVGPAYRAQIALARTEIAEKEVRVEEDYWVAAAEWADSLGADVITSSVGYSTFDDATMNHSIDELNGTTLITRAADLAVDRGIVVVIAAGNERGAGADPTWEGRITIPADGFKVLAVGATDPTDALAAFSSVGPTADGRIKPDVVAPGTQIVAVAPGTPNGFTSVRGTSFATPLVAGTAAILLQAHPDWTPAEVSRALRWTAQDLGTVGPDNFYGWGMVDVAAALEADTRDGLVGSVTAPAAGYDEAAEPVPVARARVAMTGPVSRVTFTDTRGRFFRHPLPHGRYTITCDAPGFEPVATAANVPQTEPITIALVERTGENAYRLTPNPARPSTGVTLAGAAQPSLVISFYDLTGNLVRELPPGEVFWDLTTGSGRPAAAGVYLCRVRLRHGDVWRGKLAIVR